MSSIYERIEYLIKQKGMTKKAFCEQLNISTGNMGDWKRGKSTPGTHKLIEIGAFFHVSLDWLILGKTAAEMVRENGGAYFPAPIRPMLFTSVNCSNRSGHWLNSSLLCTSTRVFSLRWQT